MKLFAWIRKYAHPLHSLRKLRLYQKIPRYFDPLVRRRLAQFPPPVYLRLFSHASLILDSTTQEASILETFRAVLSQFPAQGAVFWDLGANIGWYTWLCADVRPDCAIVSFEPDRKNLECLRRTSAAWNLQNHIIVPAAVAEHSGRANFYLDEITGSTGTLNDAVDRFTTIYYGAAPRMVEIETISLDDFARDHEPPSIIKIDIEGAELAALRGGSNVIKQYQPILFLETGFHRQEIFQYLEQVGYQFYDSDRRDNVDNATGNIVAFVRDRFPKMENILLDLGYSIQRLHEPAAR